jgi:hypothetical protein
VKGEEAWEKRDRNWHWGMNPVETPPRFHHQSVKEGLKIRTDTSTELNHALLARQKGF